MDLLFHMLIPVMLAWVAGIDRKRAFMLAPIAIIPDLDILLAAHRVYLHTLFIPMTLAATSLIYKLKEGNLHDLAFLASLYYLSHLFLDFFPGPVAILWPLTNVGYGLNVGVTVSQKSVIPAIQPHLSVTVKEIQVPNIVTDAAAITPQSLATALLFAAIILAQHKGILRFFRR